MLEGKWSLALVTVGGQPEVLNPHDIQEVCATCICRAMCCCTSQKNTDRVCLQTILLSNTFNLDEYKCVRLLIAAGQQVTCWAMALHSAWSRQSSAANENLQFLQRGVASATAAAAIYYEERRAQLSCLWYLLQSQALQDTETMDDVQQQVFQYTSALLREQQNGKRKMFTHLLQLIQVLVLA